MGVRGLFKFILTTLSYKSFFGNLSQFMIKKLFCALIQEYITNSQEYITTTRVHNKSSADI